MLERVWRKGTFLHCWWECKLVQPLWRTVWRFLQKLEIELPYNPEIPLGNCTPMFIAALFIIARTWKQPRCPSADEWIRKLWYIYTMEYYSSIKKEYIWISSNEVYEIGADYTEWSKPERKTPKQYINSISQQIWKTQQWPQNWKRSFQFQRKAMQKNAQTTTQLHSSHMLVK